LIFINKHIGDFFGEEGDLKPELNIEYKKIKEFKLEPDLDFLDKDEDGEILEQQTRGFYCIDGEEYDICKLYASVLPQCFAVMCL
jgi:hypothetical protein